jgi:hypothetical protein
MSQKPSQSDKQKFSLTPQQRAKYWTEHFELCFAETRNPVFVWEAVLQCLGANLELPQWVKAYLLETARSHREPFAWPPAEKESDRPFCR